MMKYRAYYIGILIPIGLVLGAFIMADFWNNCVLVLIMSAITGSIIGFHASAWVFVVLVFILAFIFGKEWFLKEMK